MRRVISVSTLILLLGLVSLTPVFGQDYGYTSDMSMEEYNAELEKWQGREQDAKAQIEQLKQDIADLKDQIAALEDQIAQVRQETMDLLSDEVEGDMSVEEAMAAYLNQLDELISQAEGLLALSPEELYQSQDEVEAIKKKLAKLKKNDFAKLDESQEKISELESLLERIDAKMPEPVNDVYSVVRGDYLWKISGKDDIYDDPYQWVKIWSANRDQINNPDLIYPDQKFDIPRQIQASEHLVNRGESLSKIASYDEVYGNPFDWQKIYNANKKVISDPNVIYPHQILTVPQN
ncbi:MAG: LysM peptidoglycan-binding domain-containing protein [Candidatus Marinimicrobia bacterium]|nr:LysM peptidoglycan-binding domain-containing protein [Candidatus Neomarinimicrobiota bacterium]MCF7829901.1 LysM peptidoglycan-binding domain-containing protein [Candidatus Neomarinimicrobiota bacterium]MCF7879136.1 LysM peptidoglycan-binding domain-containing protein [Candidatus Neomarinimicrobiota bacterium]